MIKWIQGLFIRPETKTEKKAESVQLRSTHKDQYVRLIQNLLIEQPKPQLKKDFNYLEFKWWFKFQNGIKICVEYTPRLIYRNWYILIWNSKVSLTQHPNNLQPAIRFMRDHFDMDADIAAEKTKEEDREQAKKKTRQELLDKYTALPEDDQ